MSAWKGRYVFVGGLHRSGTSLVARILASHASVSAIEGAPVPEQEGVFLQGAIPHTARHGIPGRFAFDDAQHLTECSHFNTLKTKQRLEKEWSDWFAGEGKFRVEKSPVNLLRMRLYQSLFPTAHFVIVTRHPVAVAQATQKWCEDSLENLIAHWGRAYDLALDDMSYLHCALILRYEDLCADPDREIVRLLAFLSLSHDVPVPAVRHGNADYRPLRNAALPESAMALGYGPSLSDVKRGTPSLTVRHYLSDIRNAVEQL